MVIGLMLNQIFLFFFSGNFFNKEEFVVILKFGVEEFFKEGDGGDVQLQVCIILFIQNFF